MDEAHELLQRRGSCGLLLVGEAGSRQQGPADLLQEQELDQRVLEETVDAADRRLRVEGSAVDARGEALDLERERGAILGR